MADGDKIVNLDGLKAVYDKTNGDITDLKSASSYLGSTQRDIKSILKPDRYFNGKFDLYPYPDNSFDSIGIKVYTDKRTFITDYNPIAHRNSGGTTYYFSPNGVDTNDGLTPANAKNRISSIYSALVSGDTCMMDDGIYTTGGLPATLNKSINIIAKNPGKVIFVTSALGYIYTLVSGNVYSTSRSNVAKVLAKIDDNQYVQLSQVNSISACESTPLSFYSDNPTLYVNSAGLFVPSVENTFLNLAEASRALTIQPNDSNINVYLEGLTFIGGYRGGVLAQNTATNTFEFHAYRCKFLGAYKLSSYAYDAVSILGGKAYFVDCVAAFARKDGFNYHYSNGEVPLGFEFNCEAYCNGIYGTDNTNNGSTIHDGGKIIRINGVYHDNYGANVADVNADTKSLNLRCIAFDSKSSETGYNADFSAQQAGAVMWLDGCKGFGSDWSVYPYSGTTIYAHDPDFVNSQGSGIYDKTWNPYS